MPLLRRSRDNPSPSTSHHENSKLEPVFTIGRTYFYIALSRDTPREAVDAWRSTLDQLKQNGTFEKLYHRYLPGTDLTDLLNR